MDLVRDGRRFQVEVVATSLIIVRVHMNMVFIIAKLCKFVLTQLMLFYIHLFNFTLFNILKAFQQV